MKKLLVFCILFVSISCTRDRSAVIDNPEHPFIVKSIGSYNETHVKYYSTPNDAYLMTFGDNFIWDLPCVVLPIGLYNVGDTITLIK